MLNSVRALHGLFLAAVLVLSGAASLRAQAGQQQQNPPPPPPPQGQQGQQGQPGQPPAGPPVNKEEEDAYKKFFDAKGAPQIDAGEDFLKKFPESRYRESVYSRLTTDYLSSGNEDKMLASGDKTLELNPNNVDVLAVFAMVIARRTNMQALDAEQRLTRAEGYGKKAMLLIADLTKPEGMTDEDFTKAKNEKLSLCHSGLGVVDFFRGKYADAVTELGQATQLTASPDPVDYYVQGLSLENLKKYDDAATAYGKCGEISSAVKPTCLQNQAKVKKAAASQPKQ
jgi:tetratricopeptide (TPR) repeat protein